MILGGIPLLALAAWQEGAEAPARLAQLTGAWLAWQSVWWKRGGLLASDAPGGRCLGRHGAYLQSAAKLVRHAAFQVF